MKAIVLADGSEWACDRYGEGLFHRREDGTWAQYRGTGQTPRFRDGAHLSRWLRTRYMDRDGKRLPRMVQSYGW